jgi:hypothetical protein
MSASASPRKRRKLSKKVRLLRKHADVDIRAPSLIILLNYFVRLLTKKYVLER